VQVIGIPVESERQGTFVVDAVKEAVDMKRVALKDIAYDSNEADGKVKIHQTKDVTGGGGVWCGGLVGAVIGLAAPPLLGATVVGAGVGALWAHFRDSGIDDKVMKSLADDVPVGHGIVFALGDDEAIAALADRVDQLTDGKTVPIRFGIDGEHEAELQAKAVEPPATE
jgi:uncharacterized membrane protein